MRHEKAMKKQQPNRYSTLPGWITPEVVEQTRTVWQPYYHSPLTDDDAIEILLNVGNLFQLLREQIRQDRKEC
jgi:hypothetical protein